MDKKLMEDSCQRVLLDIVMDSKHIKEQLSFDEQIRMCKWVKELSYEEMVPVIYEFGIREFESKFRTFLKYGLAAIAGGGVATAVAAGTLAFVGAPAIGAFTYYLYRKATDPCDKRCRGLNVSRIEKKLCRLDCKIKATRIILRDVQSEHSKCNSTKKPEKCERGLTLQEIKWEKKLQDYLTQWQQTKEEYVRKLQADKAKAKENAE